MMFSLFSAFLTFLSKGRNVFLSCMSDEFLSQVGHAQSLVGEMWKTLIVVMFIIIIFM
jgi:hypothetical protein